LIITVDNGISSFDGVELAKKSDIQVIITDHHLPSKTLPEANAIINHNLENCEFLSKTFATKSNTVRKSGRGMLCLVK
jgi:single-stranded-DNA-specific exonuclease